MPSELPLLPLQQWLQAVISHPGEINDAIGSPDAVRFVPATEVGSVVLPSKTLQPIERVGIYHGMYMQRMVDALEIDYPAITHFLGRHQFEHLIEDYVQRFPSRSYTLNRLGDHLPEFIADGAHIRRRTFYYDLARLELAMTQVFDELEQPPLPPDAIGSVPGDRLEDLRFTAIPALRLLELDYDVNAAFQAYRDEEENFKPRRTKTWMAIHRQNYSVIRMSLPRPAWAFLKSLTSGETIGTAIGTFRRRFRRFPEQQELFTWFRDWSAAGLFASMDFAE